MNRAARRADAARSRRTKRKRVKLKVGDPFVWIQKESGEKYMLSVSDECPLCGAAAIVPLPDPVRAAQPDETTHVCLPALGGCNHGFVKMTSDDDDM